MKHIKEKTITTLLVLFFLCVLPINGYTHAPFPFQATPQATPNALPTPTPTPKTPTNKQAKLPNNLSDRLLKKNTPQKQSQGFVSKDNTKSLEDANDMNSIDLGPNRIVTAQKNNFTIVGRKLGGTKPRWVKVQIFGITYSSMGKASDLIYTCEILSWTLNNVTVAAPKVLYSGAYRVQLVIGKKVINLKSKLLVPGISYFDTEEETNMQNRRLGQSLTYNSYLLIYGVGFNAANVGNSIIIGAGGRVLKPTLWTDTLIKVLIPGYIRRGNLYDVTIKHFTGMQFSTINSPQKLKFEYQGISSCAISFDDKNFLVGEINGFGFGKGPSDVFEKFKASINTAPIPPPSKGKSKKNTPLSPSQNQQELIAQMEKMPASYLTLNEIPVKNIISWTPTKITFKIDFLRSGKYMPKIIYNTTRNNKPRKVTLIANDSVAVISKINYILNTIFGSYYALSLRGINNAENQLKGLASFIFTMPQDAPISLAFYDETGNQKLASLIDKKTIQRRGRYMITINNADLSAGRYLLILEIDKYIKIPYPHVVK